MNVLLLISLGLTAITGLLCMLMLARMGALQTLAQDLREQLERQALLLSDMIQADQHIQARINQLSIDVIHREVYKGPEDRYQLAIKAAADGEDLKGLMQTHGLSTDEASLILSLHGHPEKTVTTRQNQAVAS